MRLLFAAAALIAASAVTPAPAAAQSAVGLTGFTASSNSVRVHRGGNVRGGEFRRDDRRRDRGRGDVFLPYRDYQGDTLWRADSFNDWWHERPHRAYPAWMARNQNCERQYWSGGGWRC